MHASTDQRIRELAAIIKADVRQLFDNEGTLKRIQDLSDDLRLAIAECEVDHVTSRIRSVTFNNKIDAAEEYLRFLGEAHKPEVIALLSAARKNQKRVAVVLQAMQEMPGQRAS